MKIIKFSVFSLISTVLLFAAEQKLTVKKDIQISTNNGRVVTVENNGSSILPETREEIDLWTDDFEEDLGWNTGSGWQWSEEDYSSATHSMNSPNSVANQNSQWDLMSPTFTLPALGDGETMHFGFDLFCDMPDSDGDGDDYLDDYYTVSIMDTDALAWHPTSTDSYDGDSWWCGDESVGGYLDSWIQFMDTPSFTVPSNGQLSADMSWAIEDPAGAVVAGSCTDGWDAANVQISIDGGSNWELLNGSDPYDFDCGYGWIWNSSEYDNGGSLNDLAAGWGGIEDWHNVTFDLSQYAGQDAMIRFAFGSDPAYCTLDDASITGFHVDNIMVSGALDCSPENGCETSVSGAVWVDQFYDYGEETQPGGLGWTEYLPGYPFNGNVFLDISDFAEKNVMFRIQSRYDENDDGGSGTGLWIDDFRVYKISGGNYPAPWALMGEAGNMEANLSWEDMNASGVDDFIYDNDGFDPNNGIVLSGDGEAWCAERFDLAGPSTVNTVSVYSVNETDVDVTIGAFGQVGSLFAIDPMYSQAATLMPGWNEVSVSGWDMSNSFLIGYTFSAEVSAGLDGSDGGNSMVMLGGGWDDWMETALSAGLPTGEWGIRANVSYEGAGVTYNVYQDGVQIASGLDVNLYTATGLTNNITYVFSVSATYSDGEESEWSDTVEVTPQAQTVHEEYYDDGTAESFFNAGSGNFTAIRYASDVVENVVRFKWYQEADGGAFYLKMFNDDNGMPGDEFYSRVMAGGLVTGWNTYDLSAEGVTLTDAVWVGTKNFSSTQPLGLDTDSNEGVSYTRTGTAGDWTAIEGNLMVRVFLDCGEDCDEGGDPQCTAGDVNADGIINVLDIVSTVNFVMGLSSPSDDEGCAADFNSDGIINVLDIVQIVNIIVGG